MQQRVKPERYLVKAVINLADIGTDLYEAVVIPANAEIMGVNVEVLEATASGKTLNVGFGTAASKFLTGVDVATADKNHASSVVTTANDTSSVTVQLNAAATKGKIALRVDYVLPTEIVTEF